MSQFGSYAGIMKRGKIWKAQAVFIVCKANLCTVVKTKSQHYQLNKKDVLFNPLSWTNKTTLI